MGIPPGYKNVHQLARKLTSIALASSAPRSNVDNMTLVSQLKRKQFSGRYADNNIHSPLLLGFEPGNARQRRFEPGNAVESTLREAERGGLTPEVEKIVEDLRSENPPEELREQRRELKKLAMDQTKTLKKRTYAKMFVGILTLALAATATKSSMTTVSNVVSRPIHPDPYIGYIGDIGDHYHQRRPIWKHAWRHKYGWMQAMEDVRAHQSKLSDVFGGIYERDRLKIVPVWGRKVYTEDADTAYMVQLERYLGEGNMFVQKPVRVEESHEAYQEVRELHHQHLREIGGYDY